MLLALFGIGNDTLNLVVNLLVLSLVVVYFSLIAWTFFDSRRRMKDPVLVASAVGASFVFPFIGTIIYSILRPPEFLEDAREREVEIKAAELRVQQLREQACPKCEYPVEKTFLRCPNCLARLKNPCKTCGKPVDPRWALCPYCETPIEKPERKRRPAPREAKPLRAGRPAAREAKPAREGRPPARAAKPAREGRAAREPRPTREQRRPAAARAESRQPKRPAEAQRRKSSGSRRTPARAAGDAQTEGEDKQAGSPAPGGGSGEERPRPATAS
jgi:Double zinc ribbon